MKLYTKILLGLSLGVVFGWILHVFNLAEVTVYTDYIGRLFIRLVKLVVVPLILASLTLGAAQLGDIRKVGKIGVKSLGFFMITTAVAVTIGVGLAQTLKPGRALDAPTRDGLIEKYRSETQQTIRGSVNEDSDRVLQILVQTAPTKERRAALIEHRMRLQKEAEQNAKKNRKSELVKILDMVLNMVPVNPVKALADGDMLAIIFFSVFLGLCLTLIPPDRSQTLISSFDGLNEAVLKMVTLAMETAPYGVFALMAGMVATMGLAILKPLALYGLVVLAGLLLHFLFTYLTIITVVLRTNPWHFVRAIREAMLLGFSTSSSSATLPISINVARENLGISHEVSSFVLPLGATINMDGTALYQGVAAIFIAQVFGIDLTTTQLLVMILTATLASVGAAGVPGAGMITLAVVLSTADIPAEGIALIFGLDRILDMFRTSLNIVGDLTCTLFVAKTEGEQVSV